MSEATLPMKLSPREEAYVRHWMYEEFHCNDPSQPRPAAELLEEHSGTELDLLRLIIAAICPIEGYDLAATPRPEGTPAWPWSSKEEFEARVLEATNLTRKTEVGNDEEYDFDLELE